MKFSRFMTDAKKEAEGVLFDIGEGFKVRLARAENTNYQNMLQRLHKPYLRSIRAGVFERSIAEDCVAKSFSRTVIMGWEGLKDPKGEEIPFSPEKAYELMKQSREFSNLLIGLASDAENYRADILEEEAGNSSSSSNGS